MKRRFVFWTALAVCLALAIAPALAGRADRQGDRTKSGQVAGPAGQQDLAETFSYLTRHVATQSRLAGETTNKAEAMLATAAGQDGDDAIATLTQLLQMDLPATVESEKILATANHRLGDLYEGTPSKQVHFYGIALQYVSDSGARARLETRITDLGGNVYDLAFRPTGSAASTRDAGDADTCDQTLPVILDWTEVMSISPPGDHNWRSYDIDYGDATIGAIVRIETISDVPGSFTDDTDLTLWGGCDTSTTPGTPVDQLAFNDDKPGDFTSLIITDCFGPGTYFVEVGGFFDISTPDNFTLEIEVLATCEVPEPDDFEPDDTIADAKKIGFPTSSSGNSWGRAKKEIQDHSIVPGGDWDHVEFKLTQNEVVRMGTQTQFPTFFNGFESCCGTADADTFITLWYPDEKNYGGRCNEPDIGYARGCFTDDDCFAYGDYPIGDPLPGFPDCIPLYFFNTPIFPPASIGGIDNPLALNDDSPYPGYASELLLCLPRTQPGSDSESVEAGGLDGVNEPWVLRVEAYSLTDTFNYQVQVRNEVRCTFEAEPNNAFEDATPYELETVVHGIFDFSSNTPFQDSDLWQFDVDEEREVIIESFGYDIYACDTAFQLFVGPDDLGDYWFTGISNDDNNGFLSLIDVILPPASELLGNVTADADYFLEVTSFYINPNFPYTLNSLSLEAPDLEIEPNDDFGSGQGVVVGDEIACAIDPPCDYDNYTLTITENTFVSVATTGSGDTALELRTSGGDLLACDDDGGPGLLSLVEGCVPAGDYNVEVRAFSGTAVFGYGLSISGTTGCTPDSPPTVSGDGAYTCLDWSTCP